MCLQFRDNVVMWGTIKCFAQAQVDVVSCSSFRNQTYNPITEDHQIFQAQFALTEAMLFSMCLSTVSKNSDSMFLLGPDMSLTIL